MFSGSRPQRQRARLLRVEPREGVAREHGLRNGATEGEHGQSAVGELLHLHLLLLLGVRDEANRVEACGGTRQRCDAGCGGIHGEWRAWVMRARVHACRAWEARPTAVAPLRCGDRSNRAAAQLGGVAP